MICGLAHAATLDDRTTFLDSTDNLLRCDDYLLTVLAIYCCTQHLNGIAHIELGHLCLGEALQ